jgi:RimJ/RimL family protein N-acetyltransferase
MAPGSEGSARELILVLFSPKAGACAGFFHGRGKPLYTGDFPVSCASPDTMLPIDALPASGLRLRPFASEDVADFVAAVRESVSTVGRWMDWCTPDYNPLQAIAWFDFCERAQAEGKAYDLGIFGPDGRLLGSAGLNLISREHNYCNLGYWVRQSAQRQGVGLRAIVALCRYGFEVLGLTRIECVIAEGNMPSRRLAERAGASFEGVCRNRLMLGGRPVNAALYALLPGDAMPEFPKPGKGTRTLQEFPRLRKGG